MKKPNLKDVTKPAGQHIALSFAETPTTGYLWQRVDPTQLPAEVAEKNTFTPGSGGPGAGGTRTFDYVCKSPKTIKLDFRLRRPHDPPGNFKDQRIEQLTWT